MRHHKPKKPGKKLKTSFVSTVVSIALVLFLLGVMGVMLVNANRISRYVKENIGFSVILKENIKEVDKHRLQKDLDAMAFIKSTEFVSKADAANELKADLGVDFIKTLGFNPLQATIDVKFYADYANPDSVSMIENKIMNYSQVEEVYYHRSLMHKVHENVNKLSMILLLFVGFLLLISIVLINNTIRLAIHSKRFLIRTMQLVGATENFIATPFVLKGALQGLLAGVLSLVLLSWFLFGIGQQFKDISDDQDFMIIGVLYLTIILLGLLISMLSTFLAVQKYLRIKQDDLYINY